MPFDGLPSHAYGRGQERFDWDRDFHFRPLANLDAQANIFFQRELEHIIPEMFEKQFALINARSLFPIDRSAGGVARTITWRQFEKFGQAQIVADYATDVNLVNVEGEEFSSPVRGIAVGAKWSLQEIRAAMATNRPLDRMYAEAARETMLRTENTIAFQGDAAFGLRGLSSAALGIPSLALPNGSWATSTPAQKLADMDFLANTIVETTGDREVPDTLVMSTTRFNHISSTNAGLGTDTTILRYFLANNPYIREVVPAREMSTAFGAGAERMMAYRRDPSKIRMAVPLDIEQLAPVDQGLSTLVIWHMRAGGLIVHKPASLLFGTGV